MKFTSKSVIFDHGSYTSLIPVFVPVDISKYQITPKIWEAASLKFNEKLDERDSVTQRVDGIHVDILGMAIENDVDCGSVKLLMVLPDKDDKRILDLQFILRGDIVIDEKYEVEELVIKNITYEGTDGKRHHILREKNEKGT